MYESFFGLDQPPLKITPDPQFIYWTDGYRKAAAILEIGLEQLAPISLVTGEVGTGKTTLLRRFLEESPQDMTVGLISNYWSGAGGLYRWILNAYGLQAEGTEIDLFRAFEAFVIEEYAEDRRVVLIVDEAQNVSDEDLEQLRMLTNINSGKDSLLMLVLVGQPQLRDRLKQVNNRQLAQRVSTTFHIGPLSAEETREYVRHRLAVAGATQEIFDDAALEQVYQVTGGIPRLVNILCEMMLVSAFGDGNRTIDRAAAEAFLADAKESGLIALMPGVAAERTEDPQDEMPSPSVPIAHRRLQRSSDGTQRVRLISGASPARVETPQFQPSQRPAAAVAAAAPYDPVRDLRSVEDAKRDLAPDPVLEEEDRVALGTAPDTEAAISAPDADVEESPPIVARLKPSDELEAAPPAPAEVAEPDPEVATAGEKPEPAVPDPDPAAALLYLDPTTHVDSDPPERREPTAKVDSRKPTRRRLYVGIAAGAVVAVFGIGTLLIPAPPELPQVSEAVEPDAAPAEPERIAAAPPEAASEPDVPPAGPANENRAAVPTAPETITPLGDPDADSLLEAALASGVSDPQATALGYARAAVRGQDRAAHFLAQLYETGDGVPLNLALARAWYEVAAGSVRGAERRLADLAVAEQGGSLTPPELLLGGPLEGGGGEFIWTSGAGYDPAAYVVEIAPATDGPTTRLAPQTISAVMVDEMASATVWRVFAVAPAEGNYAVSGWQPMGSPPEQLALEVGPVAPEVVLRAPGELPDRVTTILESAGIPFSSGPVEGGPASSAVSYVYEEDSAAARRIAELLEIDPSEVRPAPAPEGRVPPPGTVIVTLPAS